MQASVLVWQEASVGGDMKMRDWTLRICLSLKEWLKRGQGLTSEIKGGKRVVKPFE